MLTYLNNDMIIHITSFLSFNDIINITNISKQFHNDIFDDIFFYNLAVNYYSYNFWKIANTRADKFSKPLKNYKLELQRIEKFQDCLEKNNSKRWTVQDFYCYWTYQEKFHKKYFN